MSRTLTGHDLTSLGSAQDSQQARQLRLPVLPRLAADRSFIAVTIWQHERDKDCSSKTPRLGPIHPRAKKYFFNTLENLAQWAANREAARRPMPGSVPGWNLMKDHHHMAVKYGLPVRIVVVEAVGSEEDSSRAEVNSAAYRDDLQAVMNYYDPNTGAFEYATWQAART